MIEGKKIKEKSNKRILNLIKQIVCVARFLFSNKFDIIPLLLSFFIYKNRKPFLYLDSN